MYLFRLRVRKYYTMSRCGRGMHWRGCSIFSIKGYRDKNSRRWSHTPSFAEGTVLFEVLVPGEREVGLRHRRGRHRGRLVSIAITRL